MITGIRISGTGPALSYLDTLVVPIIENTPNEEDLKDSMAEVCYICYYSKNGEGYSTKLQAMKQYPNAAAVLVRRHGIYVWGKFD